VRELGRDALAGVESWESSGNCRIHLPNTQNQIATGLTTQHVLVGSAQSEWLLSTAM
jgi:hypothetical protein